MYEFEDSYDFFVDCHEILHKMDIVERFSVLGVPKYGGGLLLDVEKQNHHHHSFLMYFLLVG